MLFSLTKTKTKLILVESHAAKLKLNEMNHSVQDKN